MVTSAERLSEIVRRFIDGQDFMSFWRAFMDFVGDQHMAANLSPEEEAEFERIYDLVYMGQPDPVSARDASVGLRGEAKIRAELRNSLFAHARVDD